MENTLQRIKVATVNEVPKGIGKRVRAGNYEIALFHLADGNIRAVENRCPHKGGVLSEGIVSGNRVFCPMHDWKVDICSGKVEEAGGGCVQTFQVEVENGDVYLLFEDV